MRTHTSSWRFVILAAVLLLVAETCARIPLVQRAFDPEDGSVSAARWRYEYAPAPPDVLILGDSRAIIDLSPGVLREGVREQTGDQITVVNAAVFGSSMEQLSLMLSQVIVRKALPRLVLLNVSEVALNDAAWSDSPPYYLRGLARPLAWDTWQQAAGRSAVLESLSALLRLQHRLRLTVEGRWPNYIRGREVYDWGGSVRYGRMAKEMVDEQLAAYREKYLVGFAPDQVQGQFLRDLLEQAHALDLPLVLLITPVTDGLLAAMPRVQDTDRFLGFVWATAAEYRVPVFDYYRTQELGQEDYFDLHHTNSVGTAIFSRIVARDILAPALADWDSFVARHGASRVLGMHAFDREHFGYQPEDFPYAAAVGESITSTPVTLRMTEGDVDDVIRGVTKVLGAYRR